MALNPSRYWLAIELDKFGHSLQADSLLLDAGAGDQRNRVHFKHCTYESADFEMVDKPYAKSTYVCDLSSIPVPDGKYDAIVFTQVMEHLPEPAKVVRELFRVLKPGGRIFYSAPLMFHEHEVPYDFYRYTRYGVRYIFETAGFRVPEIQWTEGCLGASAYQLRRLSKNLPITPRAYGGGVIGIGFAIVFTLVRLLARPLSWLAARAAQRHRWVETGDAVNYFGVFEKPQQSNA